MPTRAEGASRSEGPPDSTVVVLAGGLSHERDVSLRSGRRVAQALRARGLEVIESDVDSALVPRLAELADAVVFPLLHGEAGEDGALREVLSLLGVPFVGSLGSACRVAFDKSIATTVVAEAGILTPPQVALPHEIFRELGAQALVAALGDQIGFPMMVKPSRGGSALGCSKVSRAEELPAAMVGAFAYGPVAVVERFIEGTEVTVAVVDRGAGPVALPAVEIRPDSGVYDYSARYTAGETRFLCPAEVTDDVASRCAEVALAVHRVLGMADLSRTDMIVGGDGQPVFLEVNVAPGMTETSAVPLAIEAAGWSLGKMCADLVRMAALRGGRVTAPGPTPVRA
ncbi:MAG TPA: D-alanine--D-alanine ligase [Propionibacteriaceae bacterium]|nr:D-alanine--D-alanine ligase [Propionibacteriaceae bacterium]